MNRYSPLSTALALFLLALALPAVLLAAEPESTDKADRDEASIVILGDDGEEITLTVEDGTFTMISTEDGETTTRMVDIETMGLLAADAVDEAMGGMDEVMAQLEEMQFQFRVGQDNRLNLSFDDSEFELDLDQIMTQVASAVQLGLDEIDTAQWASHGNRWDDVSEDELRDELDNLKDEMEALRTELQNLKQDQGKR